MVNGLETAVQLAIGDALRTAEVLVCTRDWSGWTYGTMSDEDFDEAADYEDLVNEIANVVMEYTEAERRAELSKAYEQGKRDAGVMLPVHPPRYPVNPYE